MLRSASIRLVRSFLLASCAVLLAGCDTLFNAADYYPPPETAGGWRKNVSAEFVRAQGLDFQALQDLGRFSQSVQNTPWVGYDYHHHTATIVIKNGWIVGEWYSLPESRFFQQYLASNGKSFAYVLFGVLVKDGREGQARVRVTEQSRVYDPTYLQEGFPLSDPRKTEITFEQIFRHTAGFLPEESKDGDKLEKGRNSWSDYRAWVTGRDPKWPVTGPLLFPPGHPEAYAGSETWGDHQGAYSSIGFAHLGLVFRHAFGHTASAVLWDRILQPIGFSGVSYHYPPPGAHRWMTSGGLCMTPRDYARFAYLILRKGRWEARRIVDPEWIERTFDAPWYQNMRSNVDGYFGKELPADTLRLFGSGGNFAFIVPSQDLIVIRCARITNQVAEIMEPKFLARLAQVLQPGRTTPPH
ncbi:MAG: serine hydrolase [Desulfobulbus sp.]|jgi:CubicO group peptidase (beta-lactamase class C family)|nr:serine hydrolase [Desulfobulbus sp.]